MNSSHGPKYTGPIRCLYSKANSGLVTRVEELKHSVVPDHGLHRSSFDDDEAYVQSLLSKIAEQETWETVIEANGHDSANVTRSLL
jgi:hypothetical protein